MKKQFGLRVLSLVLAFSMIAAYAGVGSPASARTVAPESAAAGIGTVGRVIYTEAGDIAVGSSCEKLWSGGVVHIYNFRQLQRIGSGIVVTDRDDIADTVGKGTPVTDGVSDFVTYAPDAQYSLEGDIIIPAGENWRLPEDFAGSFVTAGADDRLYDEATDTIYIQNAYQLASIGSDGVPVMSGDGAADTFGTGQLIYPAALAGGYLTYGAHNYIVSRSFSASRRSESPALLGGAMRGGDTSPEAGRDYFGQPAVNIGGTDYILIGCRQQLDALNTGGDSVKVYGPVYKVEQSREYTTTIGGHSNEWQTDSVELIYPGDADLISGVQYGGTTSDFSSNVLYDGNNGTGKTYHDLDGDPLALLYNRTIYCTVDPATGQYSVDQTSNPFSDLKYDRGGNYIVFRDIDLGGESWTPMMFDGSMYGVKSSGGKLWDDGKTAMNIDPGQKPAISNFNVVPAEMNGKMDVLTHMGVGFFGTISGHLDRTNTLGSTAVVRNIAISNGTVTNPYTAGYVDQTLVNGLLTGLGTVLGIILDPVLSALLGGKDVNTREILSSLLNARKDDPSSLATGAFVGRIVGNVEISDCLAENVTVATVKTSFEENGKIVGKGGFAGYIQGKFKYDGLSNALGGVADTLSTVLNLIPGVGLGDLVDVLLGNTLPVGDLIPTGYNSPSVERCTVSGCTLSDESGKLGVGGFVGTMCGASVTDCRVIDTPLSIKAARFGGGFAGVERDDIIKATLGDLGVIVGSIYPQSEIIGCSIEGGAVSVTGGDCLGGFIGAQANSYAVDCTIDADSPVTANATGDCIGGFVGKAQLGSSFGVSEYLLMDASLLSTVKGVLTGALSQENSQELLALGGVSQSGILGCRIDAPVDIVTNGSKAGGLVGSGEAVYIAKSSEITSLNKYEDGNAPAVTGRSNTISALVRVVAEPRRGTGAPQNCAGGIAGHLVSANTGSLLGDTLGLKSHLGFRLADVTANGVSEGYTVEADDDYAGGAVGFAIGGDIENVNVINLLHVTADNHAGGFVGTTGPDRIVGGNGLDLNLLGIPVLKINNLVGLTSGVHTNYDRCSVNGVSDGFTVTARGTRADEYDKTVFTAGGFAGDATSVTMDTCRVYNLASVCADDHFGCAGGFVGLSAEGSLSGVSAENDNSSAAIDLGQLLQLEADLIPTYDECEVYFTSGGFVRANAAGGFVGELRSGTVNKNIAQPEGEKYAVHGVDHVHGGQFAGGFGGKVHSGALLRDGGSGLSLLGGVADIDITGLANLTQAYVPVIRYAGVDSPQGFSVLAAYVEDPAQPATAGCAGGYIGYGSGVQVSYSNVRSLRHGAVTPPAQLEEKAGSEYMSFDPTDTAIPYAVAGARYAGGYIGYMNVGSATEMGDGLKLLGDSLNINGVLDALDVVVSLIEHSDVYGCPGGYSVLASSHVNLGDGQYDENGVGYAGGFAGRMSGSHIQDSSAENFAYIIGEIAAGGYAGDMEPGNVADLLDYESSENGLRDLLEGIIPADDMLSLIEAFVPTIRNSRTTCIPCGGAVRAQSFSDSADSDTAVRRGFAGGYVGHSCGGQIWGSSDAQWGDDPFASYDGPQRDCDAVRIRSVYGAEYAGGYVGLMEAGSTARTGNLSLLGGLIDAGNLLSALNMVYPTIEHGNVYGPLEQVDYITWNKWSEYVGLYGAFASELSKIGRVSSQEELDSILGDFLYGYNAVAGRDVYDSSLLTRLGGCAGGFAGAMHSGVIRYSAANDAKLVKAMRASGGFAGEMRTKGLAEFGTVDILGVDLGLDLGALLKVADIMVPVVFESGTTGYQSGVTVRAFGDPTAPGSGSGTYTECGMAGGFVGACYGGQIGNRADGRVDFSIEDPTDGAWIRQLKRVTGRNCVGGFAGKTSAASVVNADDSDTGSGFLSKLLDRLIGNPSQLVDALDATICVIGRAEVTAADSFGIVIDGEYEQDGETKYSPYAGGFVGYSEATLMGDRKDENRRIAVSGLRGVSGGHYVGGFFGLAQVGSVAQVGDSGGSTTILDLVKAGNVTLLDIFRTYIFNATVTGVEDGISVYAHDQTASGTMSTYQLSGAAGGFGGALMNGTVENSSVSDLNTVKAPNYSGGFIGMLGTCSGIGVDDAEVQSDAEQQNLLAALGLDLALNPQLLNVVGSTVTDCSADGFGDGFVTIVTEAQTPNDNVHQADVKGACAAGFAGFADMAHIEGSTVTGFKYAKSPQIAGGFVGRTALNYLVDTDVNSELTGAVVRIVNALVKALYLDQAQQLDIINYDSGLAGLKLMADGDLLYVNLLGLKIGASLSKNDPEYNQDAVIVTIGSSTVKLPCDEDNGVGDSPDISITLIEGNRTDIKDCSVIGIEDGYNIYGGGADDDSDGTDILGYAGGFAGYNYAGMISNSRTELCDVVRGTPDQIGPFVGYTNPRSRGKELLEANGNSFNIYRSVKGGCTEAATASGEQFSAAADEKVTLNNDTYNRYNVTHLDIIKSHSDLEGAIERGGTVTRPLDAFISPATAVLMMNTPKGDNIAGDTPAAAELKDPCDEQFDLTVSKVWKDFLYLASRPESITVTVIQAEAGTAPPDELISAGSIPDGLPAVETFELTLTADDNGSWSTAWQKVISDLPVAVRKNTGGSEATVYYRYFVSEAAVDNYAASYETDQATATAKIINRYNGPLLPTTGGRGTVLFYGLGAFLILLACALILIRRLAGNKGGKGQHKKRKVRAK